MAINIKSMAQLNKRCRSKGVTYRFDQSDSSNSGHPLAFSTTSNGSHGGGSAFTTGVTTVGTAGSAGAYVEVTLEQDAPDHLYYYCTQHSGMGGLVKTAPIGDANFASFASTFTFPTSDGTADQVLSTDGSGTLSFATASGGGGGGQPTYASINRVVSQTGGNNVVDDTKVLIDYSAHSGSGNKRFRGKWLNVSGYLKIMYYLGPTSNIVSCHLSGVLDENHTYDNTEPRNRIEGYFDSSNNRFEYYHANHSGVKYWTQQTRLQPFGTAFNDVPEKLSYLEFDIVLSGDFYAHTVSTYSNTGMSSSNPFLYQQIT